MTETVAVPLPPVDLTANAALVDGLMADARAALADLPAFAACDAGEQDAVVFGLAFRRLVVAHGLPKGAKTPKALAKRRLRDAALMVADALGQDLAGLPRGQAVQTVSEMVDILFRTLAEEMGTCAVEARQ